MKTVVLCLLAIVSLPVTSVSETCIPGRKLISVSGTRCRFDIHDQGLSFGVHPIFLVPTDTLGNVSFTGVINNIRVIGKFAVKSISVDTSVVIDPITLIENVVCDSIFFVGKHGEWTYYTDRACYRELYEKGQLIESESFQKFFETEQGAINVSDSMARIRSIIDSHLKKGENY